MTDSTNPQAEVSVLRAQLNAWHSAFGTTQLTHAIAKLEAAENAAKRAAKIQCRWDYIKDDIDGARALLLLLKQGKGTRDDFDTMVDRIIESRQANGSSAQNVPGKGSLDQPETVVQRPPWIRSSYSSGRYPIECPECEMVLHQGYAETHRKCVLCGASVHPIRTSNTPS